MSSHPRGRGRPVMGLARRPVWLEKSRDDALSKIGKLSPASSTDELRAAASAARQVMRAAQWFIRQRKVLLGAYQDLGNQP